MCLWNVFFALVLCVVESLDVFESCLEGGG
jgi:hypothetical protein